MINQTTAKLQNICLKKSRGLTYYDMQCEAVESAPIYREQDKKVLNGREELKSLGFQKFKSTNEWVILLGSKKPFFTMDGVLIGTISCFSEVTELMLPQRVKDILIKPNYAQGKRFTVDIDNYYEDLDLPKRQSEVLFFLLRGKTSKEIADILMLSPRTVEAYIDNVKIKLNCSNRSELIEKGIAAGYLSILPETLFHQFQKT